MDEWWHDGLAFSCTMCGKCCHARGDVASVYVNFEERKRLAQFLDLPKRDFDARFIRRDGDGHRRLRFVDGHCCFLEDSTCIVHEAKPVQCRTWPFWEELLESEQAYRRQVLDFCPGSQADGPVVPAESIRAQMEATEEAFHG